MSIQLSFTRFALKNLWRRRLRTILTLCGIGMGIGAFVAMVGFSRAFEHEWLRLYQSSGTDIVVLQKTFLNTTVDESSGIKLQMLPTIADDTPIILNMMDLTPEINALVYGWRANSYEFGSLKLTSGRLFRDGQPEIILGDILTNNLNKHLGDTLDIEGSIFNIVGIFHGGSALEADAVIMPIDQMQLVASLQGKVTAFHVRLRPRPLNESPDHYIQRSQAAIEAALPGLHAIPAAELASNNQLVTLAHAVTWGTSSIALLIGILGIANTMAMSVFERTREIGILRALGWKRWRILLLIQIEAAMLGFTGGIFGIIVGWSALRLLSTLPQTASIVSASFPPMLLLEALIIAVLAGLIAGAAPAWRGAQLSPVEALRHD